MQNFLLLAFVHFIAVIIPGQSFIAITRYSMQNAYKGIALFSLGIASADSIYIILAILGLSDFILKNQVNSDIFYIISSLYLMYLSYQMMIVKKSDINNKFIENQNYKTQNQIQNKTSKNNILFKNFFTNYIRKIRIFLQNKFYFSYFLGLFVTILNPEVLVFYSSIIATFVNNTTTKAFLILIWAYMTFATFVLFYIIALLFARYQKLILGYVHVIEKIFAIILLYFSYHLITKSILFIVFCKKIIICLNSFGSFLNLTNFGIF